MKKKNTGWRKKTKKELEQMTLKDHLESLCEAGNELKVLITDLLKRSEDKRGK